MTYIFNDPIHGTIELDKVLVKIIDTPAFQRLRNIKQTGSVSYVFPGATHTRFQHSIGVCHLAGIVIDRLALLTDISPVEKLCVQIAGLIHDVGHGPFSHLFDDAFIANPEWSHELQSCKVFDYILETHTDVALELKERGVMERDIIFIKELVNTKELQSNEEREWKFKGRPKDKSFLYEIVANETTGIDVDKFDYLLRDCYYLGVNCTLDWRRLVHMMKVVEKDGQLRIAIRDKEKDNVFNMFYLRMHLRRIAYKHPTATAIDFMIRDVLKLCNDLVFPDTLLSETIHDMEKYLCLTDCILSIISNMPHSKSSPDNLIQAKQLITRLHSRRLYSLVCESPPSTQQFKDLDGVLEEVIGEDKLLRDQLIVSIVNLNFGKWAESGDPLQRVLFYDKIGNVISDKLYNNFSTFVPSSWTQKQVRFYCTSEEKDVLTLAKRKCDEWVQKTFLLS